MYITGGIGSRGTVEAFGDDYELPNLRAYTETCAAVGFEQWNQRMFRLHGDAKYLDLAEQILYNGFLSGVSIAGDTFFYQNPLESDGRRERSAYFEVACCPANLSRTLAQLPGMIYAQTDRDLYVGLFIGSRATMELGGRRVKLAQDTNYPWDGTVTLRVDPDRPADFTLRVRIPGWARNQAAPSDLYTFADTNGEAPALRVNGTPVPIEIEKGFARVHRIWLRGDVVQLTLPMPVRRVLANPGVQEDRSKAAIQRGPLIYCVEGIDQGGRAHSVRVPLDARLTASYRGDLLGGITVINGQADTIGEDGARQPRALNAIPYYAWANRGKSDMAVWLP
jgi:DUF1680 family protein